MRAVGVHADVVVVTSQIWQTSCTVVRGGEEAFVIDSPVLPAELEALPALVDQAGFAVAGLLATHADWDHLLGRLAFPDAAVGVAETSAARLRALVESAETVVPGHGGPLTGERATALLDEDEAYLRVLAERGADAPLPASRDTAEQRRIHLENARAVGG